MTELKFETIEDIDHGSVALAINQALRAAFNDCADRPELKKARKVGLEISVTPVMDHGSFSYANVKLDIKSTVPNRGIEIKTRVNGNGLEFQPTSLGNPNQKTLPDE